VSSVDLTCPHTALASDQARVESSPPFHTHTGRVPVGNASDVRRSSSITTTTTTTSGTVILTSCEIPILILRSDTETETETETE